MKFSTKINQAPKIIAGIKRTAVSAPRAILEPKFIHRADQSPPTQSTDIRFTIANMQRLLQEAMGEGTAEDLVKALNNVSEHREEIQSAVNAWINLIDVLVQNTEQRYGSKPGHGQIKAAEVKGVLRYLLQIDRLDLGIPAVPRYLIPVVIDGVVDITINGLVLVANRYGLWVVAEAEPGSIYARFLIFLQPIYMLVHPIFDGLAWLLNRVYFALRVQAPLSPAIRSAVKAVENDGLVISERPILKYAVDLFIWIGTHRAQLIAALELVFAAVQEAESYVEMSGPEKKAFAHDLILAVWDSLGFEQRAGLVFTLFDAIINGSIEAAVSLFNKRGVFSHRS